MKCSCCDKNLSDFESTRKIVLETGKYYYPDMCNNCFRLSGLYSISTVVERNDLVEEVNIDEPFDMEAFNEEQEYNEER